MGSPKLESFGNHVFVGEVDELQQPGRFTAAAPGRRVIL